MPDNISDTIKTFIGPIVTLIILSLTGLVAYYEVIQKLHDADNILRTDIRENTLKLANIQNEMDHRRDLIYDMPQLVTTSNNRLDNIREELSKVGNHLLAIDNRVRTIERIIDREFRASDPPDYLNEQNLQNEERRRP